MHGSRHYSRTIEQEVVKYVDFFCDYLQNMCIDGVVIVAHIVGGKRKLSSIFWEQMRHGNIRTLSNPFIISGRNADVLSFKDFSLLFRNFLIQNPWCPRFLICLFVRPLSAVNLLRSLTSN